MKLARGAAFRPGTFSNLKSQLNAYHMFCLYYRFKPFPCTTQVLCAYACFLSKSLNSISSVRNYLSGLKTWHQLFDYSVMPFSSTDYKLTLRGISHRNEHVPVSKSPLLPNHLINIISLLDIYDPVDACLWCFLTIAFFGMLRASNLVSRTVKSFNPHEQLIRRCIRLTDSGMLLSLNWSKTRQDHTYTHQISLCPSSNPLLCPIKAYTNLVSVVPGSPDDPVLAVPNSSSKIVPISKNVLLSRFRDMLLLTDLDPSKYSFHSLRHGGATLATRAGIPELLLKHHGDWRSDCFQTYIKQASVDMFKVTKAMNSIIHQ